MTEIISNRVFPQNMRQPLQSFCAAAGLRFITLADEHDGFRVRAPSAEYRVAIDALDVIEQASAAVAAEEARAARAIADLAKRERRALFSLALEMTARRKPTRSPRTGRKLAA